MAAVVVAVRILLLSWVPEVVDVVLAAVAVDVVEAAVVVVVLAERNLGSTGINQQARRGWMLRPCFQGRSRPARNMSSLYQLGLQWCR